MHDLITVGVESKLEANSHCRSALILHSPLHYSIISYLMSTYTITRGEPQVTYIFTIKSDSQEIVSNLTK
jgi:hypothetical protein